MDEELGSFTVSANLSAYGYHGEFLNRVSVATPMVIPYEWQLPDGTSAAVALTAPVSAI